MIRAALRRLTGRGDAPPPRRTPGRLEWTCHVCHEVRPGPMIAVASRSLTLAGSVLMQMNVRFCADRPECSAGAQRILGEREKGAA